MFTAFERSGNLNKVAAAPGPGCPGSMKKAGGEARGCPGTAKFAGEIEGAPLAKKFALRINKGIELLDASQDCGSVPKGLEPEARTIIWPERTKRMVSCELGYQVVREPLAMRLAPCVAA